MTTVQAVTDHPVDSSGVTLAEADIVDDVLDALAAIDAVTDHVS
jgi:hypothetical protein